MTIPIVGRIASITYLRDPGAFAASGRALGEVWGFRHPRLGIVPVISDPDGGARFLQAGLQLAGRSRFISWLGYGNALAPVPANALAAVVGYLRDALTDTDPTYFVETALRPFQRGPGDVGPALREAALVWIIHAVCQADQRFTLPVVAAARAWQRSTRTLPLLVPSLRRVTRDSGPAMLHLVETIAACRPGPVVDGALGTYYVGGILSILGPVVDALPMLAMGALEHSSVYASRRIAWALAHRHPHPLLILETTRPSSLLGYTGRYIGVDLVGAGLPFGLGEASVLVRTVVESFLSATLKAASRYDLVTTSPVRTARVRLCVGPVALPMARWSAMNEHRR